MDIIVLPILWAVSGQNAKSLHDLLLDVARKLRVVLCLQYAFVEQFESSEFLLSCMLFASFDYDFDMIDQKLRLLARGKWVSVLEGQTYMLTLGSEHCATISF